MNDHLIRQSWEKPNPTLQLGGLCLLIVISLLVQAAQAQDYPTFDQRRDWLFGLSVPMDQISGSAKYGMPFAIAKLWQTNGTDQTSRNFCVDIAEYEHFWDEDQLYHDWDNDVIFNPMGVVRAIYQWENQFSAQEHNRIATGYRAKRTWGKNGTENHELMRWINGYLLAQMYGENWYYWDDDESLMSAADLMELLKENLLVRAEQVYRQDVSEYNSPNYLIHHLIPWLNLYDFCEDPELQYIAEAVITRHLAALALCNHKGAIIEPYTRYTNFQDLGPDTYVAGNETLLSAWIYWGQINPTQNKIQQRAQSGPWLYYLAASSYRPTQRLVEVANGTVGLPCEIKMHSTQWHDPMFRATNRRYVYRTQDYAIGSGMRNFSPDDCYMQHSKFGVHWTSNDAKRSLKIGHAYWYSDDPDWTHWMKSTDSPFMQSVHYKNVAIVMFNHPSQDPWANRGRSDWWAARDGHANALRQNTYVIYPNTMDQYIAYNIGDGTRWYFLREGNVYIGLRTLTTTWTGGSDIGLNEIFSNTQPNGQRYQGGYIVEVSTQSVDGTFENFQNRLKTNPLIINWGTGDVPAQTISYNNTLGINLTATYDTDYNENANNMIWMHPNANLNGNDYTWYSWPFMDSPYISMWNKHLQIHEDGGDIIYDLSDLPTPAP